MSTKSARTHTRPLPRLPLQRVQARFERIGDALVGYPFGAFRQLLFLGDDLRAALSIATEEERAQIERRLGDVESWARGLLCDVFKLRHPPRAPEKE